MCKTWLQYKTPFDHLTKKKKKKKQNLSNITKQHEIYNQGSDRDTVQSTPIKSRK